tara:strand:- start:567 stop:818 length:252 start_codon:yes stop_codon:yes gene_type:complete
MRQKISWTGREADGVKREVRVEITAGSMKWQFKRKDQPAWDYDSPPCRDDWDELEEILIRRAGHGRSLSLKEAVRKHRQRARV